MHVEQQAYLEDGTVIECSDIWLSGDRFRLVAAVRRPGSGNVGIAMAVLPGAGSGTVLTYRSGPATMKQVYLPGDHYPRTLVALRCGADPEALFLL